MILRLFNPSHDECLASDSPYYTPSRTAREMDAVHLPGWLCLDDLPQGGNETAAFWNEVERIEPWGWDARLVHQLQRRNCPAHLLPSEVQLSQIRHLSSRQTAVRLLAQIPPYPTDSPTLFHNWWCESMEEVQQLRTAHPALLYKSPHSCSGRGVFSYNERRILKVLREQGGIEVEPLYERVADFAAEFYCHEGEVRMEGLSCFVTDEARYGGNLVLSDSDIRALMLRYVPEAEIDHTLQALHLALTREVAPHYNGPLGIDMMIVRHDGDYHLHPCVEINLRNTMGRLAIWMRDHELQLP